eukprot:5912027-Pyramimonas_sp.AAC.1
MRRRVENADCRARRGSDSVSEPAPEPANPLLEAMRRTGTSGPGMDLLARREASLAVKPREPIVGIFNDRTVHELQSRKKIKSAKNILSRIRGR